MSKGLVVRMIMALVIGGVSFAAPQGQPAATAAPAKPPAVKSQAEGQALQAVFQASDVDSRIKLAEEFLIKYPTSDFKATVLMAIAETYRSKNDYANTIVYAERTLEADPNNYMAMLSLASTIAQRTREFDLDREEKLGKVEKYAKAAMELVKTAPKPNPSLTDEQWAQAKAGFEAEAHEALGLAAMTRKNWDVAIAEFKASMELTKPPDPATQARLGAVYVDAKRYDDAIAILDQVIATPDLDPQIKGFAQAQRQRAVKLKARSAQPAAPAVAPAPAAPPAPAAAPAPAEPKKP